ncbi:MAG: xanthine dehydrogenase accessory protein XdhC [Alphaproteobacteria bacterium]|nr:xanthine dehydrogenase accessory protein XdhC [Alphaproteobacteria bacterium]
MSGLWARAFQALETQGACVMVEVISAQGSTPREVGAQMLVTPRGFAGTIGGGTLEWQAMAEAQALLGKPRTRREITRLLGPDLGQCCGGRVTLSLECFTRVDISDLQLRAGQERDVATHLHLWGAGHVGRALVLALAPLPFTVTWWDVRDNAFPGAVPENVTCRLGAPADMHAPGLVLAMTHSHALDFEIVDLALRNPRFRHVGLIGSETKRARFWSRLVAAGHGPEALARLTCPIGSKQIVSKHPAVIAATVAVQVLEWQQALGLAQSAPEAPLLAMGH